NLTASARWFVASFASGRRARLNLTAAGSLLPLRGTSRMADAPPNEMVLRLGRPDEAEAVLRLWQHGQRHGEPDGHSRGPSPRPDRGPRFRPRGRGRRPNASARIANARPLFLAEGGPASAGICGSEDSASRLHR